MTFLYQKFRIQAFPFPDHHESITRHQLTPIINGYGLEQRDIENLEENAESMFRQSRHRNCGESLLNKKHVQIMKVATSTATASVAVYIYLYMNGISLR